MKKFFATLTLVACAATAHASDRDVVETFYTGLLSGTTQANLPARVAEVLAPDWQSVGGYTAAAKTRDQFVAELGGLGDAAPTLHWKIEEIVQAGNRFIVRGRATAVPVQPFLGAAPTGRGFDIMSIDIHTVEHHKIVKSYHVEDWHGALAQIAGK